MIVGKARTALKSPHRKSNGFWLKTQNQLKFVETFEKNNNIKVQEDWYKFTHNDFASQGITFFNVKCVIGYQ